MYHQVQQQGLPNVRILFASTGVKGDTYPPSYYVDELLFEHCINTAPLETIEAYEAQSEKVVIQPLPLSELEGFFATLKQHGVDVDAVADELMTEGVEAFKQAFDQIMESLS
jgi:Transaldolase